MHAYTCIRCNARSAVPMCYRAMPPFPSAVPQCRSLVVSFVLCPSAVPQSRAPVVSLVLEHSACVPLATSLQPRWMLDVQAREFGHRHRSCPVCGHAYGHQSVRHAYGHVHRHVAGPEYTRFGTRVRKMLVLTAVQNCL